MKLIEFKKKIRDYYRKCGRHNLPWRLTHDPYKILVSEMMLQQTQVSRVIPKYKSFLKKFPTIKKLAKASLHEVLSEWQGLGYNRRGLYLKQCAEKIVNDFSGIFPKNLKTLTTLPGIGPATAGDILAFAWNIPVVVIETNIRSVFIHFFFTDSKKVSDKQIISLIEKTLDFDNCREWYYALMDYGAFLKQSNNPSRKSTHHIKQSRFEGSNRQKRANILKLILQKPRTKKEIMKLTNYSSIEISKNLTSFIRERTLIKKGLKFEVR